MRLACNDQEWSGDLKINWRGDIGEVDNDPKVGDAFYDDAYPPHTISAAHAGKRPICIRLPGNIYFCVYSKQITDGVQHEPGWVVSGEPYALTLQPSVNVKGVWHGFITNGAFSPDVAEGPLPIPVPAFALPLVLADRPPPGVVVRRCAGCGIVGDFAGAAQHCPGANLEPA